VLQPVTEIYSESHPEKVDAGSQHADGQPLPSRRMT
jgi:hypothetical protein